MNDIECMRMAIALSKEAVMHGNEPFASVLVKDGKVVMVNENQIFTKHDPSEHGELGLIRAFCETTGITDLSDYTLYTNCEPCFMCSGAMVWAKLGRLVYGASAHDLEAIFHKEGISPSALVFENSSWQPKVTPFVLRAEALQVLQSYFSKYVK